MVANCKSLKKVPKYSKKPYKAGRMTTLLWGVLIFGGGLITGCSSEDNGFSSLNTVGNYPPPPPQEVARIQILDMEREQALMAQL